MALKKLLAMGIEQDPAQPFSPPAACTGCGRGERLGSPLLKSSDIKEQVFLGTPYRLKYYLKALKMSDFSSCNKEANNPQPFIQRIYSNVFPPSWLLLAKRVPAARSSRALPN